MAQPLRLASFAALALACAGGGLDANAGHPYLAALEEASGGSGCADGQRDGFLDPQRYPEIAGCAGGWSVPGLEPADPGVAPACPTLATFDSIDPACARGAGDDGANPDGEGCDVADLCAVGWHVCAGALEVAQHSPDGCAGAAPESDPPRFFATRQTSNGCGYCATGARTDADCDSVACTPGCAQTPTLSNDFFGCGNFGGTAPIEDCGPLDRFSDNYCSGLAPPWSCNDDGSGSCEAYAVTKRGPELGGVLCCRDPDPCPCDGGWKSHGEYVSCVAHAVKALEASGAIDSVEGGQIVSGAARASCPP